MSKSFGYNLTPKKIEIIKTLFSYRGITVDQLIYSLHPDVQFEEGKEKVRRLHSLRKLSYRYIDDLVSEGLVVKEVITKSRKIYVYLTEEGLEVALLLFDISPFHHGTGYNSDYGNFTYDKYVMPRKNIDHHFLLIDFFLKLEILRRQHPMIEIDYRDNRYVAEQYEITENELVEPKKKIYIFRPDAEVKIGTKFYWIEIDRATERYDKISQKFEGYYRYLNYLIQQNRPLPDGIIFITETKQQTFGFNRRWRTLSSAFFNVMGEMTTKINLMLGTIDDVERIFLQEYYRQSRFEDLANKLKYYTQDSKYQGKPLISISSKILGFEQPISITQIGDEHQLFMYEKLEGFETRGIARIYAAYNWLMKEGKKITTFEKVKTVVPVFYQFDSKPYPLKFEGYENKKELDSLFSSTYWLNIKKEPIWTNINGEKIMRNPLLSFVAEQVYS